MYATRSHDPFLPSVLSSTLSRRIAAVRISAGLAAGLGALSRTPWVAAQDATPASGDALPPFLQQLIDGANAGDGAAVAALYTEDGTHEDVPGGIMAHGREEIAAYVDGVVGQFRDVRLEPVFARHSGDLAVLEYTFTATDVASGHPITYRGVLVFELDGTEIRRSADYYDLAAVLGQLGLLPVPDAAGTPTP